MMSSIVRINGGLVPFFFFFRAVSLCAFHDSAYLWLFIPLLSVSSVFFSPDCSPFLLLWVAFILVLRERVLSCFLALSSQNFFFFTSFNTNLSLSFSHYFPLYISSFKYLRLINNRGMRICGRYSSIIEYNGRGFLA